MKIGIITLPINSNYGGLLQTFALQSVLMQMGHEVWTINRRNKDMPLSFMIPSAANRLLKSILNRKMGVIRTWATVKEVQIIDQHIIRFISENIRTTHLLKTEKEFKGLGSYGFDAYVVGSDQVWRKKYSPGLPNHFLGFIDPEVNIKRISYAASFGVDNWEYTPRETETCRELLARFNAVSVREDSAVKLCKEKLGVDALQVLDPTFLLSREDYISLVEKDAIPGSKASLLTYVLDKSPVKQELINKIGHETGLDELSIMPKSIFRDAGPKRVDDCIYPPVTAWLRGFMDARYVITDSFHGTVFAIIFNKPFIAIGNAKRGLTRFASMLKVFGLEDRLILSANELVTEKLCAPIDFEHVNEVLRAKKQESVRFLTDSLHHS